VGPRYSPRQRGVKGFKPFSKFERLKNVQTFPNFDRSKFNLPMLQKIGIKYSFEDLEEMDNFLHRNFFKFEMAFR
jgi:hypothetical protein